MKSNLSKPWELFNILEVVLTAGLFNIGLYFPFHRTIFIVLFLQFGWVRRRQIIMILKVLAAWISRVLLFWILRQFLLKLIYPYRKSLVTLRFILNLSIQFFLEKFCHVIISFGCIDCLCFMFVFCFINFWCFKNFPSSLLGFIMPFFLSFSDNISFLSVQPFFFLS